MQKTIIISLFGLLLVSFLSQCTKHESADYMGKKYQPIPYILDVPQGFPPLTNPPDNPLTQQGVFLGKKLFYDPILSGDNSQSCGSCHQQELAFTDGKKFSTGITGAVGNRSSMAIINLAWSKDFFWDGRAPHLEDQALGPVPNPIEMNLEWKEAVAKLKKEPLYPSLFFQAFGTYHIDSILVVKAISQFMRTLVSGNTKYDEVFSTNPPNFGLFSPEEADGYDIYFSERGDCFHCHGGVLFTDNIFHNNGLDATFSDKGRYLATQNPLDIGKFKSPTLRNIEYTAPYMHDGRFATLEEVVIQYSFDLKNSPTIDPLMKNVHKGGVELSPQERAHLIAFLKTLSDPEFLVNPAYSNPNNN